MRLLLVLLAGCASAQLPVRSAVLYQNGVGYFERAGRAGDEASLRFAEHELHDVLETLTVLDGAERDAITAELPRCAADEDCAGTITLRARGLVRVAYAVPVPAWRAAYRVMLPERGDEARLQAWALVHNASEEDWEDVDLRLATAAPFTFANDLATPRFVPRPDAAGALVSPSATGIVSSERGRRLTEGPDDLCPDDPEDLDGFRDDDGCPDPDNDGDRIRDVDDQCPNDPETYNGTEDTDGCPDRGLVLLESSEIRILESVFFASGSATPAPRSAAILDAVAATLAGNPQLVRVVLEGHADPAEADAWRLSAERAGAVRAALLSRGIDGARLEVQAFGASRLLAPEGDPRNARVRFHVEEAEAREPEPTPPPTRARAEVARMPGGAVYEVAGEISVRAGATSLVTLFDEAVRAEHVLLFRPDPAAAGSDVHPMRAARLVAPASALVAGPVSLFGAGRFLGEGQLAALAAGAHTFVPFAVERSARVASEVATRREPRRIRRVAGDVVVVEDAAVVETRYRVDAGSDAPARLFLRHPRRAGHALGALPPGSEEDEDAALVALPLRERERSEVVVLEERSLERRVALLGDLRTDLALYLERSSLPASQRRLLEDLLSLRGRLRAQDARLRDLRGRLSDAATRTAELRRDIEAAGDTNDTLRRTLRAHLRDAADETEALSREIAALGAERSENRATLQARIRDL